jgi:hypothetical protein
MKKLSFKTALFVAHADGFITYEEVLAAMRSAMLNRPQPSLTLQEPNLPKSFSHGSVYDTIERDDLNKRDM